MMAKPVHRDRALEDLPNVGAAVAADLRCIGVRQPGDLRGRDPYALYAQLNRRTGTRHDPCVLDTFIAAVRYVEGAPARPWWHFTSERKRRLAAELHLADATPRAHAGSDPRRGRSTRDAGPTPRPPAVRKVRNSA